MYSNVVAPYKLFKIADSGTTNFDVYWFRYISELQQFSQIMDNDFIKALPLIDINERECNTEKEGYVEVIFSSIRHNFLIIVKVVGYTMSNRRFWHY